MWTMSGGPQIPSQVPLPSSVSTRPSSWFGQITAQSFVPCRLYPSGTVMLALLSLPATRAPTAANARSTIPINSLLLFILVSFGDNESAVAVVIVKRRLGQLQKSFQVQLDRNELFPTPLRGVDLEVPQYRLGTGGEL